MKFNRFRMNKMVAQNPHLIFCSTVNCETVLDKNDAKKKKVNCPMCKKATCAGCNLGYHGAGSCEKHRKKQFQNWTSDFKIHFCPKCGTQIEKNGGCPHMYCSICNHSWCWTCGFGDRHCFHTILFGGVVCALINEINFAIPCKLHWTIRLVLGIIGFALAPAICLIGLLVGYFIWAFGEEICRGRFLCFRRPSRANPGRCCWTLAMTFIAILLYPLAVAGACIVVAVCTPLGYLCLLIVSLHMMFRWFYQSKEVKDPTQNKSYVNKYRVRNGKRADEEDMDESLLTQ